MQDSSVAKIVNLYIKKQQKPVGFTDENSLHKIAHLCNTTFS